MTPPKPKTQRRRHITETLPAVVEAVLLGREPGCSTAFAQLKEVWAPLLSKLRAGPGRGNPEFDSQMDEVLLRACRRCNPANLVFKWWYSVLRNAALDMYAKECTIRRREQLTECQAELDGVAPEPMSDSERDRMEQDLDYLAEEVRATILLLPSPEREMVERWLDGDRKMTPGGKAWSPQAYVRGLRMLREILG
jgi:hypothetical protein